MKIDSDKWHSINVVLVIDDDDNWCYLSERILRRAGYEKEIIIANNGKEAVRILETNQSTNSKQPELILLDIKMPVMDGFEFLEAITHVGNLDLGNTRIYMCSSSSNPKDKEKANGFPIAGFITKPLTKEILEDLLG